VNSPITISVITICFNNLEELKTTLHSVDQQQVKPYEHWIIDGSSNTDIKNYLDNNPQPDYRKWLSEKDNGIADAFNKGIVRSEGRILNMLNSGDYYIDATTLQTVSKAFEEKPVITWLHGKYKLLRGGVWVVIGKPFEPGKLYRGMRSVAHQSMFVEKTLHTKYGLYDTSLNISMDYDFVCRIAEEPFAFIENPLIVFAPDGTSQRNYLAALQQAKKVYEKYFGKSLMLEIWQLRLKTLYHLLNGPAGSILYKIKVWLKLENM